MSDAKRAERLREIRQRLREAPVWEPNSLLYDVAFVLTERDRLVGELEAAEKHVAILRESKDEIRQRALEECLEVVSATLQEWRNVWPDGQANSTLLVADIAAAIRKLMGGERGHKLGCDEAHEHHAPKCCAPECWCRSLCNHPPEHLVRNILVGCDPHETHHGDKCGKCGRILQIYDGEKKESD